MPTSAKATATPLSDTEAVERALRIFIPAGDVTEVRALDGTTSSDKWPRTWSGYFNDPAKAAAEVARLRTASNIYFIPNVVDPGLLARAVNRLKSLGQKGTTTSDGDILRRRRLLIDVDSKHASGISATDEEHEAALAVAEEARSLLCGLGWPDPVIGDSGNGGHLVYAIDLPAEDGGMVQRILSALASRFNRTVGNVRVEIDTSVYNPARPWKLYGTKAGKGDDAGECGRPHRLARIIEVPERFPDELVPMELLERFAALAEPAEEKHHSAGGNGQPFDVPAFIAEHHLDVGEPQKWTPKNGGAATRWVFKTCPFNDAHTDGAAYLIQMSSGAVVCGCHHKGCQGKKWADLRTMYEGVKRPAADEPIASAHQRAAGTNGNGHASYDGDFPDGSVRTEQYPPAADFGEEPSSPTGPPPSDDNPCPEILTAGQLVDGYPNLRPFIIDRVLRDGETANIIAAPKMKKSWMVLDLALAVTTGRPWFGFDTSRGAVLLIDNECHRETLADRIRRVARARGIHRDEWGNLLTVCPLRGKLLDINKMAPMFAKLIGGGCKLVIIDALYRALPVETDEGSNGQITAIYNLLDYYAERAGSGIICIHHASKGAQGQKSVTDVGSGAGAQSRAVDQHITLREHTQPDVAVMDAAPRSCAPIPRMAFEWSYPVWVPIPDGQIDVNDLKTDRKPTGRPKGQPAPAAKDPPKVWTIEEFARDFVSDSPRAKELILAKATDAGMTERQAGRTLLLAEEARLVHRHSFPKDLKSYYSSREQNLTDVSPQTTPNIPLSHTHPPHTPPSKRGRKSPVAGE